MNSMAGVRRILSLAALAAGAWLTLASLASAQAAQGAFERTLKVTGPVDLSIRSGSGDIRVIPGADGTVRVSARIRAYNTWFFFGDAAQRVREIEKNPPVEQDGNTIRLGHSLSNNFGNVGISYDVTVPARTTLNARTGSGTIDVGELLGPVQAHTGSGDIVLGRVGGPVVASTGSGGIEANGAQSLDARTGSGSIKAAAIGGPIKASSGSGEIRVALAARGDVDVSSSSGNVAVTGIQGAARVSASSGAITVEGRPTGPWNVHSSSGGVTLRLPADAAFDLDARASSGGIDSRHPVTMVGQADRHRVQGKVRGGGALVAVSSSSGGIRIE